MKALLVCLCMGCLLLVSCQCDSVNTAEDKQALEDAIASFYQAVDSGDGAAATALFADDFIMMPNGGTIKQGRENIFENWEKNVEGGFRLRNVKVVDFDFDGTIAYRVNEYDYGYPDKNGEMQWWPTKNIHIWKKQADGSWKLHADIWNSTPEAAGE
ncbi:MAG: SgcJ/EcaC family oxidoreductase [Candidatus Zixiibacteriota bacterium]